MTYISRTYALNLSRITRAEWLSFWLEFNTSVIDAAHHLRPVAPDNPDIMDKLMNLAQRNCADLLARWRDPFDDRDYI